MRTFIIFIIFVSVIACRNKSNTSLPDEENTTQKQVSNEYSRKVSREVKSILRDQNLPKSNLETVSELVRDELERCIHTKTKIAKSNETWLYCKKSDQTEIIIYTRTNNTERFREIYCIEDGKLIYAFEEILSDFINPNNNVTWNCQYGIENDTIYDYVSLGHGETENDEWKPESILNQWKSQRNKYNELITMANKR